MKLTVGLPVVCFTCEVVFFCSSASFDWSTASQVVPDTDGLTQSYFVVVFRVLFYFSLLVPFLP